MICHLLKKPAKLGENPPNTRLGEGCVPQTPSKIIVLFFC
ncbi:hypothetical protein FDUTEX481_02459 [Tolypothrix sp. PCC 7601]|nr:hypothetical protein FDUTEX481_02459 [Tolypothrix sp. PCC 7601]